jgi:hypothetical protein
LRVLLIKGGSQYGVVRIFTDDAKAAFEAAGHETVMLDISDPEVQASFAERVVAAGTFDFAYSIQVAGTFHSTAGQSLSELIKAPHVLQYVDHPYTNRTRLPNTPRNVALLLVDRSHIDLVNLIFGPDHFAYLGFNPHAAIGTPEPLPADAEAYGESRPIRLLFAGTNHRPDTPLWNEIPANVRKVFSDAADLALSKDWLSPHRALIEVMAARGMEADNEHTRALLPYCEAVNDWVRRTRRFTFLKAAGKAKLPLTVVGKGYEKDAYRLKSFDFKGPADFKEILSLMRQSRIVLNVNGNFGEGSHERPLCAMMAGAVCASERSTFYEENFDVGTPGADMAGFIWSTLEDDLQRIAALSEDPGSLLAMARSSQAKTAADHTWANRIAIIIDAAEQARRSSQW